MRLPGMKVYVMNFIQIEGWAGSGKGVLWSLLDGHSEIFVNPIHDFSHCAIFHKPNHKNFRKLLSNTEYYKLEKLSKIGFDPIDFGANACLDNPFHFDFYEFDGKFGGKMATPEAKITAEFFIEQYSKSFIEAYKNKKYDCSKLKYFASMGNYYEFPYYLETDFFEKFKTIFIRRDVEGIIASRVNREKREVDDQMSNQFAPSFKQLMSVSDVEAICYYNELIENLSDKYPKNLLILEFEDLVMDPARTMLLVSEFLGVQFEKILLEPTRDGEIIKSGEITFTGQVNDKPHQILTKIERVQIAAHAFLYKIHKHPINFLNINAIGIALYRFLKKHKIVGGL